MPGPCSDWQTPRDGDLLDGPSENKLERLQMRSATDDALWLPSVNVLVLASRLELALAMPLCQGSVVVARNLCRWPVTEIDLIYADGGFTPIQ